MLWSTWSSSYNLLKALLLEAPSFLEVCDVSTMFIYFIQDCLGHHLCFLSRVVHFSGLYPNVCCFSSQPSHNPHLADRADHGIMFPQSFTPKVIKHYILLLSTTASGYHYTAEKLIYLFYLAGFHIELFLVVTSSALDHIHHFNGRHIFGEAKKPL